MSEVMDYESSICKECQNLMAIVKGSDGKTSDPTFFCAVNQSIKFGTTESDKISVDKCNYFIIER